MQAKKKPKKASGAGASAASAAAPVAPETPEIDEEAATTEQRPNAFSLLMTNAAKRPPEECL